KEAGDDALHAPTPSSWAVDWFWFHPFGGGTREPPVPSVPELVPEPLVVRPEPVSSIRPSSMSAVIAWSVNFRLPEMPVTMLLRLTGLGWRERYSSTRSISTVGRHES